MRVFILALGTRGDLELFLILGRELARRGHDVTLGSAAFYEALVRRWPVAWAPVSTGTQAELVSVLRSLASVPDRTARTFHVYDRWLRPQIQEAVPAITAIAARCDYFISNLKMVLRRGDDILPGAAVTYDPPGDLADLEKYRTQEHGGRILDLVAMSRPLIDPRENGAHPTTSPVSGLASLPPSGSRLPNFAAFLETGTPPVVITLGSMVMFDVEQLVLLLTEALDPGRPARDPGVGMVGDSSRGIAPGDRCFASARSLTTGSSPGLPVSSIMAAAGTISAALRAGRVSLVLPQITAQELFARVLAREGLATATLDVPPGARHPGRRHHPSTRGRSGP